MYTISTKPGAPGLLFGENRVLLSSAALSWFRYATPVNDLAPFKVAQGHQF